MTVADLIDFLHQQPQDLPVAYRCCDEQVLLWVDDITITDLCLPSPSGWIENNRKNLPTQPYLLFPGN